MVKKVIGFGTVLIALTVVIQLQCSVAPTTFASLDPNVKYTGIKSCQTCHKKIYESYVQTGMGRSMYLPKEEEVIESFGPQAIVYDRFSDFYYQPYWDSGHMYIREFRLEGKDTLFQRTEKVDYIVGSGHQTRSYLMERNDYLYEMPITWYVNKQIWDLSPGYENGKNSRFSREIGEECLTCHTGQFDFVEGSKNRYRKVSLGIDCERCHGPGEVHVKEMEAERIVDVGEETDYSIVNPAKLPLDKQFDVCQQCHLQGVNVFHEDGRPQDFRPGHPLSEIFDVFLTQNRDPEAFGIASHAERLQESQCFIQSKGKLTCTTCHDPHKSISLETDTTIYIQQCQSCHQTPEIADCNAPESTRVMENGDCVSCHMPSGGTSDIPHVSFHDHKIRVVDTARYASVAEIKDFIELVCATSDPVVDDILGKAWLQYFERNEANPVYLDKAVVKLSQESRFERARLTFYKGNATRAKAEMERLVKAEPENVHYLFFLGEIRESRREYQAAYESFFAAYQLNPELIDAGLKAGANLLLARQGDPSVLGEAKSLFEELSEKKPFEPRILANLGFISLNQRNMKEAESYLVKALSFNPDHEQALENIIYLNLVQDKKAEAKGYFDRLVAAHPDSDGKKRLEKVMDP